jgi:hypothetical protein
VRFYNAVSEKNLPKPTEENSCKELHYLLKHISLKKTQTLTFAAKYRKGRHFPGKRH